MDNLTRRRFLGWTSAGAAGAGLLALAPRLLSRPAASPAGLAVSSQRDAQPSSSQAGFSDPIVAYVHNASSGNIALMVGTREVAVHDPELVERLLHGAVNGR